jgi:peptide/nickel transport system ATP-binding protein
MTEPVLRLDNVGVSYATRRGDVAAVRGLSLDILPGESVGLVGESGCGKSTAALAVLRFFSGRGRMTSGRVLFRGRDMAALDAGELAKVRGGGIAMVYQDPMSALNPSIVVGDQLAEVPWIHRGTPWEAARRQAREMLGNVRLADPDRIMASYPHQISGGQQQRAVIAMALLANPSVLLLDEPTTGLDVTVEAGVVELIGELRRGFNTSLVYISHNLGLIAKVCDRVAVMYAGEIVESGPIDAIFRAPRHPYTAGLFRCIPDPSWGRDSMRLAPIPGNVVSPRELPEGCAFAPRCAHSRRGICDSGHVALEPAGEGREVRCRRWRDIETVDGGALAAMATDADSRDRALTVVDLSKHYDIDDGSLLALIDPGRRKTVKANDNLSFAAERGRTLAIVGESGCGKSTLAKVVMGLELGTDGEAYFGGNDLSKLPVRRRRPELLRRLQMVFQNPDETLNPSYSVGRQVGRAVRKLRSASDRSDVDAAVARLFDLIRLDPELAGRKPRQLSGGQKQRIGIARAFAGQPDLVVADEPVSSLDVSVRAAITELLLDIQRAHGTTLILISHDLGLVRYIADHVAVMYLGRIMEVGTVEQVFRAPYHPYTEALLAAVPVADPTRQPRRRPLFGDVPSALDPPKGCVFHTRCPRKRGSICETETPPDRQMGTGHRIVCHLSLDELAAVDDVFPPASAEVRRP